MPEAPHDAYFAGIIDGEGYVAVERYQRSDRNSLRERVVICVSMTHRPTIEALQARWPGPIYFRKRAKEHWKDQWVFSRVGNSARAILVALRPYVITKRDDFDECIRFLKEQGKW